MLQNSRLEALQGLGGTPGGLRGTPPGLKVSNFDEKAGLRGPAGVTGDRWPYHRNATKNIKIPTKMLQEIHGSGTLTHTHKTKTKQNTHETVTENPR